ncbi:MAG: hypothetical protein ACREQJ_00605 [Candidatus Binatia bacterium]
MPRPLRGELMASLFTILGEQMQAFWSQLRAEAGTEGLLPLLQPIPPYDGSPFLSPISTLATMIGLAVLSGVALGAFGILFAASLGIYLILTEVLGITIEVRPFKF